MVPYMNGYRVDMAPVEEAHKQPHVATLVVSHRKRARFDASTCFQRSINTDMLRAPPRSKRTEAAPVKGYQRYVWPFGIPWALTEAKRHYT